MIEIGEDEMRDIAAGAAILGAGGSGDSYIGRLLAASAIRERGKVKLIEASEVRDDWPVVLVGGGGIIVPRAQYDKFEGVSGVERPENFQYANAIGAAIAQVSGEVDRVFSLEHQTRGEALNTAKELAVQKAVSAGASRDRTEVVDIDEVFLSYVPSNSVRIRVKAAGPLSD